MAAETVPGTQPDGHAVGPSQGRHQCRQAVRDHGRTGGPDPRPPRGTVEPGSPGYLRCPPRRLLVETDLVKKLLRSCLGCGARGHARYVPGATSGPLGPLVRLGWGAFSAHAFGDAPPATPVV